MRPRLEYGMLTLTIHPHAHWPGCIDRQNGSPTLANWTRIFWKSLDNWQLFTLFCASGSNASQLTSHARQLGSGSAPGMPVSIIIASPHASTKPSCLVMGLFEDVDKFKCFGLMFVTNGQDIEAIISRMNLARSAIFHLQVLSLIVAWNIVSYKRSVCQAVAVFDNDSTHRIFRMRHKDCVPQAHPPFKYTDTAHAKMAMLFRPRCKTSRRWADQGRSSIYTATHGVQANWSPAEDVGKHDQDMPGTLFRNIESSAAHDWGRTGWKPPMSAQRTAEPVLPPAVTWSVEHTPGECMCNSKKEPLDGLFQLTLACSTGFSTTKALNWTCVNVPWNSGHFHPPKISVAKPKLVGAKAHVSTRPYVAPVHHRKADYNLGRLVSWGLQVFLFEELNKGIVLLVSALVASERSWVDSIGVWTSAMATDSVCRLMKCTMGLIHVVGCWYPPVPLHASFP